jgi:hypothetical protein
MMLGLKTLSDAGGVYAVVRGKGFCSVSKPAADGKKTFKVNCGGLK